MKLQAQSAFLGMGRNIKIMISGIGLAVALLLFTYTLPALAQKITQSTTETFTVPFTKYQAVKTTKQYSGTVVIVVSGVGQASARDYSDAFYIYTHGGVPLDHPVNANEFGLQIDGEQSNHLLDAMPDYAPDHIYVLTYDVGSKPRSIGFSIGELGLKDNTGRFTIRVNANILIV